MTTPEDYGPVLDESASPTGELPVLDLAAGTDVGEAANALEAFFVDDTAAEEVVIQVADEIVGVSSRETLALLGSTVVRGVGDGAGATLPGASLRYRIPRFACPSCDAAARRIHVDHRDLPMCPNGHGPMELVR